MRSAAGTPTRIASVRPRRSEITRLVPTPTATSHASPTMKSYQNAKNPLRYLIPGAEPVHRLPARRARA